VVASWDYIMQHPKIMQPTHARWERVSPAPASVPTELTTNMGEKVVAGRAVVVSPVVASWDSWVPWEVWFSWPEGHLFPLTSTTATSSRTSSMNLRHIQTWASRALMVHLDFHSTSCAAASTRASLQSGGSNSRIPGVMNLRLVPVNPVVDFFFFLSFSLLGIHARRRNLWVSTIQPPVPQHQRELPCSPAEATRGSLES
jgi:hypothetical protein